MHAVDTNVLVRLLTGDDVDQTKRVAALFKKETIFIPKTVLLETEWVLRRLYRLNSMVIVSAFRKLSGLGNVEIEQPLIVTQALQWCEDGMDFSDALHLASSQNSRKFATFDEQLKKSAPRGIKPVVQLL
jgi:predicted nucleic-acid-binding protein